jgi:hypothetical protein
MNRLADAAVTGSRCVLLAKPRQRALVKPNKRSITPKACSTFARTRVSRPCNSLGASARSATLAPVAIFGPCARRWRATLANRFRPRSCVFYKWQKRRIVISFGAGSRRRSIPTKLRIATESYQEGGPRSRTVFRVSSVNSGQVLCRGWWLPWDTKTDRLDRATTDGKSDVTKRYI